MKQVKEEQTLFEYWFLCVMLLTKVEQLYVMYKILIKDFERENDEWLLE